FDCTLKFLRGSLHFCGPCLHRVNSRWETEANFRSNLSAPVTQPNFGDSSAFMPLWPVTKMMARFLHSNRHCSDELNLHVARTRFVKDHALSIFTIPPRLLSRAHFRRMW